MSPDAIARRELWREAAEKRIEHGVDWPRIVLTLFGDIDEANAEVRRLRDGITGLADQWDAGIQKFMDDYEDAASGVSARMSGETAGYIVAEVSQNASALRALLADPGDSHTDNTTDRTYKIPD